MEQTELYLVTTLIEFADSVSDGHALYSDMEKAKAALAKEVEACAENFLESHGEYIIDLPCCKEWREEDGQGFTVSIEPIAVL